MRTKIVFMGSPEFALPTLRALAENFEVVGVVTQPDRPAGRGRQLTPPPVKELAVSLSLPVIQPNQLKETAVMAQLTAWAPEVIAVAAFGQILRPPVLELPPNGCLNVHASLLPRWRGAAPIQAAILHGDEETGVTIMKMDPGLDTGPILSQAATPIEPQDTAQSLSDRLAEMGADLLVETIPGYLQGEIIPQEQEEGQATLAPRLEKSAGELDFTQTAEQLARKVRAFDPWPGTFTYWQGNLLKIHKAKAVPAEDTTPGKTLIHEDLPAVETASGYLVFEQLQPAGKRAMEGTQFLLGARTWHSDPLK